MSTKHELPVARRYLVWIGPVGMCLLMAGMAIATIRLAGVVPALPLIVLAVAGPVVLAKTVRSDSPRGSELRGEAPDERERLIRLRAEAIAGKALALALTAVVVVQVVRHEISSTLICISLVYIWVQLLALQLLRRRA